MLSNRGLTFRPLAGWRERHRVRRLATGDTPEKLAEDARCARQLATRPIRSSADPALWTAVALWLWRGPLP
jgi:hypothetical protein